MLFQYIIIFEVAKTVLSVQNVNIVWKKVYPKRSSSMIKLDVVSRSQAVLKKVSEKVSDTR